ncbi:cAMP-specific 3',5'-cyclic phosphodiesterase 4D [Dirofilaria immitis]|nr:cAMP-specific 3',5'-cyclic phosphodiesterase 4D [Dirofilaria immitis]
MIIIIIIIIITATMAAQQPYTRHISFTTQKRDPSFNQFLRPNSTDFSFPAIAVAVDAPNTGNLKVGPSSGQPRRESFLYRPSIDERELNRSTSRTSSITSIAAQYGEDLIVTPFAQILASLRNVRNNLILIANIPSDENRPRPIPKRPPLHSTPLPADVVQCGHDTLDELDWCLDQLETIQTHRSVSDMASNKFRKMLNKELIHFAESSKSGTQISQFLINTYMDKDDDEVSQNLRVPDETASTSSLDNVSISLLGKAKTAAMSRIIGIRKLKSPRGSHVPEYGVDGHKELEFYMQKLDEWGPNIFKIQEFSKGHSLTSITFTIMEKRGLLKTFEIPSGILLNYLLHLEHHYKDNPYHNQIHAADVTQSVNVLISSPALQNVFSELEVLASIFAGAIHDVDHPDSELAIMYNDESVLEQHHLAVAFKLLQDSNCNFILSLNKNNVLATDMSKHMNILADLKTMVMQTMIHLADLSNPTKPIDLYRIWVKNIMEEYWRQGDRERDLGIDISPMCDRNNITIAKSQVGFIDYIVHPLFETWADLVNPHAQYILDQLEFNREWYQTRIPEEQEKQDVMIEETDANVEATTNFQSSQHQQQQPSPNKDSNLKQFESSKVAPF